jgi:hypothetical protein
VAPASLENPVEKTQAGERKPALAGGTVTSWAKVLLCLVKVERCSLWAGWKGTGWKIMGPKSNTLVMHERAAEES